MQFKAHLIASAALAVVLYPRRPVSAAAVVAAGTLIDLDHLLLYALQTGDWTVSGALRYDRYRHRRPVQGDTRPRYGPLRSLLHEPWLLLPIIWAVAVRHRPLRPAALGLTLHLALDNLHWPQVIRAQRRARGRCQICGRAERRLQVRGRASEGRFVFEAVCRACQARGR